ncbi:MAG: hypothetical protein MZV65_35135 [Chromatiales bacterium]|nr:hypothetical protein [Chromatiales bacterium]
MLMATIAVDSISSMKRISREIEVTETGAYNLALSTMDLALWMHHSTSAIETAALASRKDLSRTRPGDQRAPGQKFR